MRHDFFGLPVTVDTAATTAWYTTAQPWGCACGHCRNFLALAEERKLPAPLLEVLDALHIPAEKATYVCEIYPTEGGHCYQFSYRIAGTMAEETKAPQPWGDVWCKHEIYPYGAPDFPEPHFDLEFWLVLPWVLDEPDN